MNNKKLTIGLFNDTFYPMIDGVVSVVNNYATELSKYANVIVFVPEIPGKKYDDSVFPYKVVRCKSKKLHIIDYSCPIPKFDKEFMNTLNNSKLDIVHIHSPFFVGKCGVKYAKEHNIPVIGTMHSQFKQDIKRFAKVDFLTNIINNNIIKVFNECDECWAVNEEVGRIFYKEYGYKKMPRIMNNATEMVPIKNVKEANDYINKKHNISKNDKVFLFVGRLNKLKNIIFLANSLKMFKNKYPKVNFKMLYIGDGQDEQELRNTIKNNHMEKEIILCGKVSDRMLLAKYFCRSDLFLFPSLYDASSIVQIEAASQKTPAIFLEGAATSATITNNVNGWIVKQNEELYADKIYEVVTNNRILKKVSENAYNDLYITWEDNIKKAYSLYKEIIEYKKESN